MKQIRPRYAEGFRCIGSACEDTCCNGWKVAVDEPAYKKLQELPAGPLRTLIDASVLVTPPGAAEANGAGPPIFASIHMTESNQCPMLSAERLCRIQAEFGEAFLPHACATYPRFVHAIGGIEETALALSCPEAARLVLLKLDLLEPMEDRTVLAEMDDGKEDTSWLPPFFWPIREVVLGLIRNRAYPLWQRLFLLSVMCRRLESIASGELNQPVPEFLADFEATVATGALRTAMETMPADGKAQLDGVLRLAGMMLHRSNVRPRFVECVNAFTTGIGNGPGATLESLTDHYTRAHERFFAPFIDRHPQILENFLINTIVRYLFPFGREGVKEGAVVSMSKEFALLTAQFALMRGLLIGVAGFHREKFSAEHVVHTMQAASKHFDHHPEFLKLAHELLVEHQLDGPRGLTILLRDATSRGVEGGARPASPEVTAPVSPNGRPA